MKGPPAHWTTLKKLIYLKAARGSSPSWIWQLLTGTAPLTLLDAVAHPIHSLTQYGLCVQDGTPTPDAPVDILCNNGALRYGAMGSNLLDPSAANVVLGYYIAKADGVVRPSPANFMFAKYMPVEPGKTYVAYGRAKSGNDLSDYNRVAWYDSTKTWIAGADYTQNRIAVVTAPQNAAYALFSVNPSGSSTTVVTQEMVDSFNWTFAEGTAEIIPFEPFVGGIYTEGESEVLTVSGKNLLDPSAVTAKKYINASGQELPSQSPTGWLNHSDYIRVTVGEDYTLSVTGTDGGSNTIAFNWFDANKTILATRPTQNVTSGTTAYTFTNTAPADAAYLIVNFIVGTTVMVEESSTATDYEPYVTPQTVSVPMLLGVGDYKDEVELISGIKTGKIGIKVLDGTENWSGYTSTTVVVHNATSAWGAVAGAGGYCTHLTVLKVGETTFAGSCRFATAFNVYDYKTAFGVADVAGFKAKLATLYAAGTPVIVLYPLATETTEQGTAHSLHTSAGTNVVDVTAAVEGVTVSVEYAKQNA